MVTKCISVDSWMIDLSNPTPSTETLQAEVSYGQSPVTIMSVGVILQCKCSNKTRIENQWHHAVGNDLSITNMLTDWQ